MHASDRVKSQQYSDFFMRRKAGRRKLRLGHTSTVGELMYGRDLDHSDANPHRDFMRQFGDHAGVKSGEKGERKGKKGNYSMSSVMDTVIWGRDMDKSGVDPREEFTKTYTGHAGFQTCERPDRPSRKGAYAMTSVMDSVIWGRDFDNSGADPHEQFAKTYSGHAGVVTVDRPPRPFRKPAFSNQSVMDSVIWGHPAHDDDDPHVAYMRHFDSHAGVKAGQKPDRPFRKPGVSMKSSADVIIWGRDIDGFGDADHHGDHFEEKYGGYAGRKSAGTAKRRPASAPASRRTAEAAAVPQEARKLKPAELPSSRETARDSVRTPSEVRKLKPSEPTSKKESGAQTDFPKPFSPPKRSSSATAALSSSRSGGHPHTPSAAHRASARSSSAASRTARESSRPATARSAAAPAAAPQTPASRSYVSAPYATDDAPPPQRRGQRSKSAGTLSARGDISARRH